MKPAELRENPLIHRLLRLNLEPDDFVIFGSAPLFAHGILRRELHDLDVVARGRAWEAACRSPHGVRANGAITGDPMVHFENGRIQVSQRWIDGRWDTDRLIDGAEIIAGLRFAQLTEVLRYKQMLTDVLSEGQPPPERRHKDIEDIEALMRLAHAPEEFRFRPALRDLISRIAAAESSSGGHRRVATGFRIA
jgi:hypothetical protein